MPRLDEAIEVVERAEPGLDRRVAARLAADRPRAAGIVRARRRACCCGPCGSCGRSGGSAAGRGRRSPSPRCRAAAPRPRRTCALRVGSVPAERGNISYQAPKRARSRSTVTSQHAVGSASPALRSGVRAPSPSAAATASAAATRCRAARSSRRPSTAAVAGEHAVLLAAPRRHPLQPCRGSARPLRAARSSTSCAGADFLRQLVPPAARSGRPSLRPCTRSRPARSTVNARLPAIVAERRHRHLAPGGVAALPVQQRRRQRRRGRRRRCRPRRSTSSPTVRLIGNRPASTSGCTPSMITRRCSARRARHAASLRRLRASRSRLSLSPCSAVCRVRVSRLRQCQYDPHRPPVRRAAADRPCGSSAAAPTIDRPCSS